MTFGTLIQFDSEGLVGQVERSSYRTCTYVLELMINYNHLNDKFLGQRCIIDAPIVIAASP